MRRFGFVLLVACSSSPSTSQTPSPAPRSTPDTTVVVSVDAAPPIDAAPAIDPALAAAPASVFRFHSTGLVPGGHRLETWTLRRAGDRGLVLVERMLRDGEGWKPGTTTQYVGTASGDDKTLTLALAAGTDKLALACKRTQLPVAAATAVRKPAKQSKKQECGNVGMWSPAKTSSITVWNCKHPDFEAPMPFAAAPGVEYLYVNDDCQMQGGGYRAIAADGAIAPAR